jgi:mannose-1-phosphate guanylyltransferase
VPAVNYSQHTWALVLAAGDGTRLHSLTTLADGQHVPKQFCSLQGGPSLLQEALQRAGTVALATRICAVVAARHHRWWASPLQVLPSRNVIVQPENRGTAHGILLPLLQIAARDPDAIVVLLPADHHVQDEVTLAQSLRRATRLAAAQTTEVFLLGVEPDQPDSELGYILPADGGGSGPSGVASFVEKPSVRRASELLDLGALWNVFMVAATARALLALFANRLTASMGAMQAVTTMRADSGRETALTELYRGLGSVDFSRDVLEGQEAMLRVLPVPFCGWSDLGTPQRVAETLRRLPRDFDYTASLPATVSYVNLAHQHALSGCSGIRA